MPSQSGHFRQPFKAIRFSKSSQTLAFHFNFIAIPAGPGKQSLAPVALQPSFIHIRALFAPKPVFQKTLCLNQWAVPASTRRPPRGQPERAGPAIRRKARAIVRDETRVRQVRDHEGMISALLQRQEHVVIVMVVAGEQLDAQFVMGLVAKKSIA